MIYDLAKQRDALLEALRDSWEIIGNLTTGQRQSFAEEIARIDSVLDMFRKEAS